MAKKVDLTVAKIALEVDPTDCPFREFRDSELGPEFWGLGPSAFQAALQSHSKLTTKNATDSMWVDDQIQPLPRSVRRYLHGWRRAENLAMDRWEAEVVVFEDGDGGKMNIQNIQLSHAQVLQRSSFSRAALSACFILERVELLTVEHQWENFSFVIAPDGWRPRCHIYSPGMKPGGGQQHRPGISKNGCYLVRLFHLGAWRCVWVSDQVPVDATDSPLLPFSPHCHSSVKSKPVVATTAPVIQLWPLLICKALLKLAAPDMNSDEDVDFTEDEDLVDFDIMHALTGSLNVVYTLSVNSEPEEIWKKVASEVPVFSWDDDDDTMTSTVKTKSTKKPSAKETCFRGAVVVIVIKDTMDCLAYTLQGITPGHEMSLFVQMARDLPLKKPLPEPEVALWKYYRWVEWARSHGLYDAYACPRTRFLKITGLMKLSHAPHLLDIHSTDSITIGFREDQQSKTTARKGGRESKTAPLVASSLALQLKEELREWVPYESIVELMKSISTLYFPSMYQFTSAGRTPPIRLTKAVPNKSIDILAPKQSPLYLQIDGPQEIKLKISLNMLHPRLLFNSGIHIEDYIEPGHLVIECFEWFEHCELALAKAYLKTKGYNSVEVNFQPGRHFCRVWVHSRMNWHMMMLSEASLLLGTRDVIQAAAVHECPWAAKFLSNVGAAFINWIRTSRSSTNFETCEKDFFQSYLPDLDWDPQDVGYDKKYVHWMLRKALQSILKKQLNLMDYQSVCAVFKRYFRDPDFGMPEKSLPPKSLKDLVSREICDCILPETEEVELYEEQLDGIQVDEVKPPLVDDYTMNKLLTEPIPPGSSQICELASEELPCGLLKIERDKIIRKHKAATILQAHWRGVLARKCLSGHIVLNTDVLKIIMDYAFGNLDALSNLMNEFFIMFPGAKHAYSVASALNGGYSLQQHTGTSLVTSKCKWVPFFQGIFYCHEPVKVHFDLQSSMSYQTIAIYNNDKQIQLPQVYNAHITFEIDPNVQGYTVMGHGTVDKKTNVNFEVHWTLTVLTSTADVFHVCDNNMYDICKPMPLTPAHKFHIDELFVPNRRNILGGIQLSVLKHETVSFRAAASTPEIDMIAILKATNYDGEIQEISRCTGKGEIYWPYIRLEPAVSSSMLAYRHRSLSQANLAKPMIRDQSARSLKSARPAKPSSANMKSKHSATKVNLKNVAPEAKLYSIEVSAPAGWPLTLDQWKRVDEVRNTLKDYKVDTTATQKQKTSAKEKSSSAKDKEKEKEAAAAVTRLQPDDAYVELECSLPISGGVTAKRDDERDLELASAIRSWDAREPGRNLRGAQIRSDFRAEYLESLSPPSAESVNSVAEEMCKEEIEKQRPSPITGSIVIEEAEEEEEARYLTMPQQLRDKFVPLYFVQQCTKELNDEAYVLITPDKAEAAKKERQARIEAALERMRELQVFNEIHVLGRQKMRGMLLEKLFIDSQWSPELTDVLEKRDDAIALEALTRSLSMTKKKQESKKK